MYGIAGAKHTPGQPDMNSKADRLVTSKLSKALKASSKGKAGQRPLRNVDSKYRHKEAEYGREI